MTTRQKRARALIEQLTLTARKSRYDDVRVGTACSPFRTRAKVMPLHSRGELACWRRAGVTVWTAHGRRS